VQSHPDASIYINDFLNEGWTIDHIVLLNTNAIPNQPTHTPQPQILQTTAGQLLVPSNILAHQIRQPWK
jgi:hypothetical protein